MRLREARRADLPDLRRYLDLVTLGTIADIVPMVEENRVLVKYGLRELAQTDRPGIVALKRVSGVDAMSTGVGRLPPGAAAQRRRPARRRDALGRAADHRRRGARPSSWRPSSTRRTAPARRSSSEILDEAIAQVEARRRRRRSGAASCWPRPTGTRA